MKKQKTIIIKILYNGERVLSFDFKDNIENSQRGDLLKDAHFAREPALYKISFPSTWNVVRIHYAINQLPTYYTAVRLLGCAKR